MTECRFFASKTWMRRCWTTAARTWTVEDAIEAVETAESVVAQPAGEADVFHGEDANALLADVDVTELAGSLDRGSIVEAWAAREDLPDSCPHEHHANGRCIFHAPAESKSSTAVEEAFLSTIRTAAPEATAKQFVGAQFGRVDFEHRRLDGADNYPIDLRYATFDGDVELTDTVVNHPIYFDRARFRGDLRMLRTQFTSLCSFEGARFDRLAFFEWAEFENKLEMNDVTFTDGATFTAGSFHGDTNFWDAAFGDDSEFKWVEFHGYPDFEGASFGGEADFGGATFHDDAGFVDTTFDGPLLFRTDFGGFSEYETHVYGVTDFREAAFAGVVDLGAQFDGPTTFEGATFHQAPEFADGSFGSRTCFRGATISSAADFTGVEFDTAVDFRDVEPASDEDALHVDFTDAVIPEGTFRQPDSGRTYYDFTEATVGDLDLTANDPEDGSRHVFDVARFDRTAFDGFDFTKYKRELAPDWRFHGTSDGFDAASARTPSDLEATYLKAKNGAKAIGDSKATAEFFLQEMRYRRVKHWRSASLTGSDGSAAMSTVKWLTNWVYNLTCGYGERPLRSFGISIVTIVLFAFVYATPEWGGRGGFVEGLEFSFQSFVAFIVGSPPSELSTEVRLLASFEAFLGAFLIALFVFTLTRSLHR